MEGLELSSAACKAGVRYGIYGNLGIGQRELLRGEQMPREQVRQPGADHRIHRAKYRDSIFLALLLSLVATGACEGQGERKNVCPIDA